MASLLELTKRNCDVKVDSSDLILYGHRSCYIDDQRRVVMSGERAVGHTFLHRLLCATENCVDHINGDSLDNRKSNLRAATLSQNQGNRRLNDNSTSGYKGVNWHKASRKYRARITINGKEKYLGIYATAQQAALAYNKAALAAFGSFAQLNSVDES